MVLVHTQRADERAVLAVLVHAHPVHGFVWVLQAVVESVQLRVNLFDLHLCRILIEFINLAHDL